MNKAAYKTGAILTLAGVGLYWLRKMWGKDGTCAYTDTGLVMRRNSG